MERLIEIEGVQYTEAQIKRALAIERDVRSPNFIDMLLGKIELSEFIRSVDQGDAGCATLETQGHGSITRKTASATTGC